MLLLADQFEVASDVQFSPTLCGESYPMMDFFSLVGEDISGTDFVVQ
jgi:hypothetical protein